MEELNNRQKELLKYLENNTDKYVSKIQICKDLPYCYPRHLEHHNNEGNKSIAFRNISLDVRTLNDSEMEKIIIYSHKGYKLADEEEEVEIKQYSVIYQAIDDVKAAMKGMLDPIFEEKVIGNVEVRQVFKVSNVGTIAGAYVLDGKIERNAGVRVLRENVVIHEGKLVSLKRFKDDVKEVAKGYECGMQIEDYNDLKEGDIIEVYVMEEVKRK